MSYTDYDNEDIEVPDFLCDDYVPEEVVPEEVEPEVSEEQEGHPIIVDEEFKSCIVALRPEELDLLEKSIKKEGCRDSLVLWGDILVDGHNRLEICEKFEIEYKTTQLSFTDRNAVLNWIEVNQLSRRNLTKDQFTILIGRLYKRDKKNPTDNLPQNQKRRLEQTEPIGHFVLSVKNAGNGNTANDLGARFAVSERTIRRAEKTVDEVENNPELKRKVMAGKTIKEAKKEIRKVELKKERKKVADKAKNVAPDKRYQIIQADIEFYETEQRYDYIITDPPYKKEFLHLYETLAKQSIKWLKPGGMLIAMCGQSYLSEIYAMLSRHLDYYWTACYHLPGQPTPLRHRNVNTSYKPLLMYTKKGDTYSGRIFGDFFTSDRNEKNLHEWGQSESGMLSIIRGVCNPGVNILDPFWGSGTTGVASIGHNCLFTGIDIDQENVDISMVRLKEVIK